MSSIEWKDLHLSADQYFELMYEIVKNSGVFDDMTSPWHPEDLHYNMFTIFETAGKSIVEFTNIVSSRALARSRQSQYNSDKKTVDDMKIQEDERVPVFGGTLPANVFGDNA